MIFVSESSVAPLGEDSINLLQVNPALSELKGGQCGKPQFAVL